MYDENARNERDIDRLRGHLRVLAGATVTGVRNVDIATR
jgi:hypothetical protein